MVDYNDLLERLAVSAGDQECLYADAKAAIEALQTRLAEAEDTNNALRVRLGSELERANELVADLQVERNFLLSERASREKQEPALYVQSDHIVQAKFSPFLGRICQQPFDGPQMTRLYAATPVAAPVRLTDEQAEKVDEAIREALGDAYDCLRVWNAWSYGTMGPDDFSQVAEDPDRVAEIRNAAAVALGFKLEGEQ